MVYSVSQDAYLNIQGGAKKLHTALIMTGFSQVLWQCIWVWWAMLYGCVANLISRINSEGIFKIFGEVMTMDASVSALSAVCNF